MIVHIVMSAQGFTIALDTYAYKEWCKDGGAEEIDQTFLFIGEYPPFTLNHGEEE